MKQKEVSFILRVVLFSDAWPGISNDIPGILIVPVQAYKE